MKIVTDDKLIIEITKEEFKKAFSSFEELQKFREDLISLLIIYNQCDKELEIKDPNSNS